MKYLKQSFGIFVLFVAFAISTSAQNEQGSKPNMMANVPEGEAVFTDTEIKDYYLVYENKTVKHVKTVIERYLKNSPKLDDETEHLKDIDKAYLKSKFNVLSRDPDMFGNTHIMLIFVDKPDKVFTASVYTGGPGGEFRLDRLEVDKRFNGEDLRRIRIRYKKFLDDKIHTL